MTPWSYTWERIDLGTESLASPAVVDDGSRPLVPLRGADQRAGTYPAKLAFLLYQHP